MNDKYDKSLEINKIIYEWDDRKNEINIKKHGISFETATRIFLDKNRIEIYDEDHSDYNEDRYISIGMVEEILYVVYTDRENNIRLISARIASNYERFLYYNRKG